MIGLYGRLSTHRPNTFIRPLAWKTHGRGQPRLNQFWFCFFGQGPTWIRPCREAVCHHDSDLSVACLSGATDPRADICQHESHRRSRFFFDCAWPPLAFLATVQPAILPRDIQLSSLSTFNLVDISIIVSRSSTENSTEYFYLLWLHYNNNNYYYYYYLLDLMISHVNLWTFLFFFFLLSLNTTRHQDILNWFMLWDTGAGQVTSLTNLIFFYVFWVHVRWDEHRATDSVWSTSDSNCVFSDTIIS